MSDYYDRYSPFRNGVNVKPVFGVKIPILDGDKYTVYKHGVTRLDIISNQYYNNPYSGWLIMLANQEYGGLEFDIPNMSLIRIPYPYNSAITRYQTAIKNNKILNGE